MKACHSKSKASVIATLRCHGFFLILLALLSLPAKGAEPRLLPAYHSSPGGPIQPGTSFVGTTSTDPDGNPFNVPATVSLSYTDGVGQILIEGPHWDSAVGSYIDLSGQGPGIIVQITTSIPDFTGFYTSYINVEAVLVPIKEYLANGLNVYSSMLGYSISSVDASGNAWAPSPIKTYSHPTIWADTLLVYIDTGSALTFTSGALYADGSVVETYEASTSTPSQPHQLRVARWQGPTPTNKSHLMVLESYLPDGWWVGSGVLDTTYWETDTGTMTTTSGTSTVTFHKNYPN